MRLSLQIIRDYNVTGNGLDKREGNFVEDASTLQYRYFVQVDGLVDIHFTR